MKIYTKTGDEGTTGLFGGARVAKTDPRVEAYGTVDEANSAIGVARAAGVPPVVDSVLEEVQADLFVLGAELATVAGKEEKLKMRLIDDQHIRRLEGAIDEAETSLAPLQNFVLPGGTPGAAGLHHARTVSRRAERRTLEAAESSPIRQAILVYLNRLSDLLFVLARQTNHLSATADQPWNPRS